MKHLQEIDKNLGGYTMMKMQYSRECATIRQNLADYFNDILDYKLAQIEKEEEPDKFLEKENKEKEDSKEEGVAKKLNLKDETLLDSLDKYKSNINTACKPSPKLKEYANIMLNSVEVFVNDIILAELEKKGLDKAKIEEENKKNEEKKRKMEEEQKKKNEESRKAEEEAMKKLEKERDDAIRSLGVKPIGAMDGDKAIEVITKQYSDMLGEIKGNGNKVNESALPQDYADLLKSDTYVGISKSLEELNWEWDDEKKEEMLYKKFTIRVILNKINTAFNVISDNKNKKLFKGVPSASVQAMMMSLSNAVLYGFVGDKFKIESDNARLSLMTKCAIDSDATIGFNLPLINPKKPENGNFFVSIMEQFKSADINSQEVDDAIKMMSKEELKDIKSTMKDDSSKKMSLEKFAKEFGPDLMKTFRQNMSNLFDMILSKSKQIKEDAKKAREAEAAKAQQESEANEKSE